MNPSRCQPHPLTLATATHQLIPVWRIGSFLRNPSRGGLQPADYSVESGLLFRAFMTLGHRLSFFLCFSERDGRRNVLWGPYKDTHHKYGLVYFERWSKFLYPLLLYVHVLMNLCLYVCKHVRDVMFFFFLARTYLVFFYCALLVWHMYTMLLY